MIKMGRKKGENASIGKQYSYFFPNQLKTFKIAKNHGLKTEKRLKNFSPAARTPSLLRISYGARIYSKGGGGQKC